MRVFRTISLAVACRGRQDNSCHDEGTLLPREGPTQQETIMVPRGRGDPGFGGDLEGRSGQLCCGNPRRL